MIRVVALLTALSLLATGTTSDANARATTDRPDEVDGPQVHVVYAVPSDGEDRHLDDDGTLEGSVTSFQRWLAGETSGANLRMDTYQGSLDVTFVRLDATDAELAAQGAFVREGIEARLQASGFRGPDKIYAVYYDGTSTYSCGGAFWPPRLPGSVVAVYLRGLPSGPAPCASNRFAGASDAPAYWEYGMLHEILHGFGLVAECAPNHHRAGHVTAPNDDLMWAGDVGYWTFPAKLDVGRDDYYGHGRSDCPDLARSPYLTSSAPERPATTTGPPKVVSSTTTAARAGRAFRAVLKLDSPIEAATCVGRLGTRRLRETKVVRGKLVQCTWQLPRGARGKRFTGSVTATTAGGSATRRFSRRVA